MADKIRCFALRTPTGPNQSPAVCQETGVSGQAMRRRCPIPSCTTTDCHFNGKPIPRGFLFRWRQTLEARAREDQNRQG